MKIATKYLKLEIMAIAAALAVAGCSHYRSDRGGTSHEPESTWGTSTNSLTTTNGAGGMGSQSLTNQGNGSSVNESPDTLNQDQNQDLDKDQNTIPSPRGDSEPSTPTPQDNNPQ